MAVSLATLVRLLEELCTELQVCLDFEEKPAKPSPIMVGDFAAEVYNGYLDLAKEISHDPLIQSFQAIEKLGEYERPMEHVGEWGTDPRMQKMHEVSFSARRLLGLLQGQVEAEAKGHQGVLAVTVMLDALGKEIKRIRTPGREPIERFPDLVRSLVDSYNKYLEVALGTVDDPVFKGLFQRLEFGEESGKTSEAMLTELGMAQWSLQSYLKSFGGG